MTPLSARYVLKRLDVANDTRDALGSAFDFTSRLSVAQGDQQAELMRAQIRQAEKRLARLDLRRASRFRRPRDLPALGVATLALAGFVAMSIPVQSTFASIPPSEPPPSAIKMDSDLMQEAMDNLKDVEDLAKHLKDQAMFDFLKEYKQLLESLHRGTMTREQFEEAYKALMQKYFQGSDREQGNQKQIAEQIKEVGKDLAKSKLTKALGEALEKHDMAAAREELKKLVEKMDQGKLTPNEKKELAKAIDRAAKALQNKDAKQLEEKMRREEQKLEKQVEQAQKQLERLQRRLNEEKDPGARQNLKRQFQQQKRQLEQLKRQRERQAEQRRTLEKLSRSMQDLANQLSREKMDDKTRAALEQLMKEMSKYQNQAARGGARGQAQLTLEQLKEMLKRLRSQRQGQKGALSDYLDRARQGNQGKGCKSCQGTGQKPGGKGPCPSCGGSGRQGGQGGGVSLQPGAGGRQGGLTRQGGQGGDKQGGGQQGGSKWGTAHKPETLRGRPTDLAGKHDEQKADAKQGAGPSEAQVFQGGADKGFSSRDYRKVYVQYKKIWQEVLNQEEIPPGYRYLVERYFRLVKPR
ncbi:MAG: hypothetical protein RBU30_23140, partial [Polyangia bacterium]|jgi:hypothetical protein|nr:hypothetical protein [Polyangia bacterium]